MFDDGKNTIDREPVNDDEPMPAEIDNFISQADRPLFKGAQIMPQPVVKPPSSSNQSKNSRSRKTVIHKASPMKAPSQSSPKSRSTNRNTLKNTMMPGSAPS